MANQLPEIDAKLTDWITRQRLFFVATAPLAADGLVNCSPKGLDTFRILGPHEVAYLDLTGSGVETIAHLEENGRVVLMFCAFEGPPKIIRLHGHGTVHRPDAPTFDDLHVHFPDLPGTRSIIHVAVTRISDSCGFAVPKYDFVEDRDTLVRWAERKGDEGLTAYRTEKNTRSLDGLPGF